jgi:hypothetical protein
VSRITLAALIAATLIAPVRVFAQANGADPLIGTWNLDRSQSTYSGAAPERRTMKFEKTPKGIVHTTESMQGEVVYKLTYTFQMDGKDYPADVQMPVSTVAFKKIDGTTYERSGKYLGMVAETVTYKLSADGKTLTVDQMGNLNGAEVTSHQVFTKQ